VVPSFAGVSYYEKKEELVMCATVSGLITGKAKVFRGMIVAERTRHADAVFGHSQRKGCPHQLLNFGAVSKRSRSRWGTEFQIGGVIFFLKGRWEVVSHLLRGKINRRLCTREGITKGVGAQVSSTACRLKKTLFFMPSCERRRITTMFGFRSSVKGGGGQPYPVF